MRIGDHTLMFVDAYQAETIAKERGLVMLPDIVGPELPVTPKGWSALDRETQRWFVFADETAGVSIFTGDFVPLTEVYGEVAREDFPPTLSLEAEEALAAGVEAVYGWSHDEYRNARTWEQELGYQILRDDLSGVTDEFIDREMESYLEATELYRQIRLDPEFALRYFIERLRKEIDDFDLE